MTAWRRITPMIVLSALTLLAIACSDDDDNSHEAAATATEEATATSTPAEALDACSQAQALQQSVQDLAALDILEARINGVVSAVDQAKTNAQALKEASETLAPDIDAFLIVVNTERQNISRISNRQISEEIEDVQSAVARITSAQSQLQAKVDAEC
jgi:hypothetical protein